MKDENIKTEKHYVPYIHFKESILEVEPNQQLHQPLKLHASLKMAIQHAKKRLDRHIQGFIVREIVFNSDGHLISDKEVHKYKKRKPKAV